MWTYAQSTGKFFDPSDTLVEIGYAGKGIYKNDPASQCVKYHGPLPRGQYTIEAVVENGGPMGPFVLPLTPDEANDMCGRGGFFIHGDKIGAPGTASDGCIVLYPVTRHKIDASLDRQLQVIA